MFKGIKTFIELFWFVPNFKTLRLILDTHKKLVLYVIYQNSLLATSPPPGGLPPHLNGLYPYGLAGGER